MINLNLQVVSNNVNDSTEIHENELDDLNSSALIGETSIESDSEDASSDSFNVSPKHFVCNF